MVHSLAQLIVPFALLLTCNLLHFVLSKFQVIDPRKTYSFPADIWSLGCSVLEMIIRGPPFGDLEWVCTASRKFFYDLMVF
jgi:serine/threonine protein kinase